MSRWYLIRPISDKNIYESLKDLKECYGGKIKPVFVPATLPSLGERELIYSRAASKFQKLMIIEE